MLLLIVLLQDCPCRGVATGRKGVMTERGVSCGQGSVVSLGSRGLVRLDDCEEGRGL